MFHGVFQTTREVSPNYESVMKVLCMSDRREGYFTVVVVVVLVVFNLLIYHTLFPASSLYLLSKINFSVFFLLTLDFPSSMKNKRSIIKTKTWNFLYFLNLTTSSIPSLSDDITPFVLLFLILPL